MIQHFDVIVIGAGLSGIGAGVHLTHSCPTKSFAILEARDGLGGTWDLFRYPGIRSDSDMFTLGYRFKPWNERKLFASGPEIREYIREAAREHDVEKRILYRHRVVGASWSSEAARWTLEIERGEARLTMTCSFLWFCSGYYKYEAGYTPEFGGIQRFQGLVVHPQKWTDDIDYEGKRVIVIGSGATAVTLVPALAERAKHVVMLQRSPTYIVARPADDAIAKWLQERFSESTAYRANRWKNVLYGVVTYALLRSRKDEAKRRLVGMVKRALGPDYDVAKHFTPSYDVWDQRLCLVPDGDLFEAIRAGRASVVTDHIETFTERGIKLRSGEELEADLVITATGLEVQLLGGATLSVDGREHKLTELMYYKGAMLSDVPNAAMSFGYTNASWTLKADLISEFVCRLLNHMDRVGAQICVPKKDATIKETAFVDFTSGYIQRSLSRVPKQGSKMPWRLYQNYLLDLLLFRYGRLDDGHLKFLHAPEMET